MTPLVADPTIVREPEPAATAEMPLPTGLDDPPTRRVSFADLVKDHAGLAAPDPRESEIAERLFATFEPEHQRISYSPTVDGLGRGLIIGAVGSLSLLIGVGYQTLPAIGKLNTILSTVTTIATTFSVYTGLSLLSLVLLTVGINLALHPYRQKGKTPGQIRRAATRRKWIRRLYAVMQRLTSPLRTVVRYLYQACSAMIKLAAARMRRRLVHLGHQAADYGRTARKHGQRHCSNAARKGQAVFQQGQKAAAAGLDQLNTAANREARWGAFLFAQTLINAWAEIQSGTRNPGHTPSHQVTGKTTVNAVSAMPTPRIFSRPTDPTDISLPLAPVDPQQKRWELKQAPTPHQEAGPVETSSQGATNRFIAAGKTFCGGLPRHIGQEVLREGSYALGRAAWRAATLRSQR